MQPIYRNHVARIANLRQALDAADGVASQLCSSPETASEAHRLLLKLRSIRAELDLLDSCAAATALPLSARPYLSSFLWGG